MSTRRTGVRRNTLGRIAEAKNWLGLVLLRYYVGQVRAKNMTRREAHDGITASLAQLKYLVRKAKQA